MMVRTIQHPGVQIQETEIGSYTNTVVMNNAYVMGFTDRGPIYDYSFISTTQEFTKIYGEPTTEAEKFLFIAVQSILENGGTPIVARMPYDNKQCQAYKALKLKWIDKTDIISPRIDSDLATPLVPLDEVTKEVDMDKKLSEVFASGTIAVDGIARPDLADTLTVRQAAMLLNPYETGNATAGGTIYSEIADISGLTINGVKPSTLNIEQTAVQAVVDSLGTDAISIITRVPKYNVAYTNIDCAESGSISSLFLNNTDTVIPFSNGYLKICQNTDYTINENSSISAISDKFDVSLAEGFYVSLYRDVEEGTTFNGLPVVNCNGMEGTYGYLLYGYLLENTVTSTMVSGGISSESGVLYRHTKFGKNRGKFKFTPSQENLKAIISSKVEYDNNSYFYGGVEFADTEFYIDTIATTIEDFKVTTTIDQVRVYPIGSNTADDFQGGFFSRAGLTGDLTGGLTGDLTGDLTGLFGAECVLSDVSGLNDSAICGTYSNLANDFDTTDGTADGTIHGKVKVQSLYPLFTNTVNGWYKEEDEDGKDKYTLLDYKKLTDLCWSTDQDKKTKLVGFLNLDSAAGNPAVIRRTRSSSAFRIIC